MKDPEWLRIMNEFAEVIIATAQESLLADQSLGPHYSLIPVMALFHLQGCLQSSMIANLDGQHSVAICLVRQCVESLTIIDLGLQPATYRQSLLQDWEAGKKSQGEVRKALERDVWGRYGHGLWDESWSEYYANLAHAVQPYAHYTPQLLGWQMAVIRREGGNRFLAKLSPAAYDPLKASRITLFHALTLWTIGRLLVENGKTSESVDLRSLMENFRKALASSKLLFKNKDWAQEMSPHVLFRPGHDWIDP